MVLLGIDYGRHRIGLALAVNSIIETKGWLDWAKKRQESLVKIKKLCQEERVDKIIIGLSGGQMAKETKEFANLLFGMLQLPQDFVNESLTSWQAEKMVGWKDKGRIDTISAALILKRYLGIADI